MEQEQAQLKKENRAKTKSRERNWKLSIALILLKGIAMISLIVYVSFVIHSQSIRLASYALHKADKAYVHVLQSLPPSLIPKESNLAIKLPLTLAEAIRRVAKEQRVPEVALAAMVEQESSNGEFLTSGLEERTYLRLKKSMPDVPDERLRQLARSHGPAHVMGITALEICDMDYLELYDNYKGLTCAAKYLKIQLDKNKHKAIEDRLWQAFKAYNGTGEKAEIHADKVFALMKKKMVGSLDKEIS